MQCGPVRHQVSARAQAASRPFEHFVLVQPTPFQPNRSPDPDKRVEFQTLYQELTDDQARTRRICEDVIDAVHNGRSPLILTERNDHLDRFKQELATRIDHVVVLRASMGKKQRHATNERLAAIPRHEGRVIPRLASTLARDSTIPVWTRCSSRFLYPGEEPSRSTLAGCIVSTTASAKYASTTTPILTCRCWRECSTGDVAATRRSGTRSFCRPARCLVGLPMWFSHQIPFGSVITPVACEGSFETASTRRWRPCSCIRPEQCRKTPRVQRGPEVHRRRSSTRDWTR